MRIENDDIVSQAIRKMCDGNDAAWLVLESLMRENFEGFLVMRNLDAQGIYGADIAALFELCNRNIKTFSFRIQNGTGAQALARKAG